MTEVPKSNWDKWWPSSGTSKVVQPTVADEWSPFWHLDFFVTELAMSPEGLYQMIAKINSKKDSQPDLLLSQSYIIAKWMGYTGKKEIYMIVEKMDQGIQDELLYPKNYVENIRLIIDKVKGSS